MVPRPTHPTVFLGLLVLACFGISAAWGQEPPLRETKRLAPDLSNSFDSQDEEVDPLQNGYQLLYDRKIHEAIAQFDAILEEDPTNTLASYGRAAALMKIEDYEQTLEEINRVLQQDAEDLDALSLRGIAHYNILDFKKAVEDFEAALTLAPTEAFFYEALAWSLLCANRPDQASKAALRANQLYMQNSGDPAFSLLLAYLGFRMSGNSTEAQKILRYAAEQLDPIKWPFPIIAYFSGIIDENGLIVEVSNHHQETEARTYIALNYIWRNKPEKAKPQLKWVCKRGNPEVFEQTLAMILLADIDPDVKLEQAQLLPYNE